MKLLFARRHTVGSLLIRFACWSHWSHVAVLHGDEVIEAVWPRVRTVPFEEWKREWSAWELVDFPCPDDAAGYAFARAQIGKRYDWTALVGIAFRQDWAKDSWWFCSEHSAASVHAARRTLFRAKLPRVTPQHLYMLQP